MGELLTQPQFELTPPEPKPQDKWERLMQVAIEKGASADAFSALVDSIMKARKEDARLEFEAALGRFKEDLPSIFKTKKVRFANKDGTQTGYDHAELSEASEIIADSLKKYGLTHNWRPSEGANGRTLMTCVFRHPQSGHVEDMATIGAPPDTSGGKNNVQAVGSTISYLERYSLLAAAGIAAKGMDDDGAGARDGMPEDAITDYSIQMQDATSIPDLQSVFRECYKKAKDDFKDQQAMGRLAKVYETRKRELRQP